jgi:hypothetical protein
LPLPPREESDQNERRLSFPVGVRLARLVYACRFDVPSSSGSAWVIDAYRDWIDRHYQEKRGLTNSVFDISTDESPKGLPDGHSLERSHHSTDIGDVTLIEWAYPAQNDITLRWRNDVRIGSFDGSCSVEHLIGLELKTPTCMRIRRSFWTPFKMGGASMSRPRSRSFLRVHCRPLSFQRTSVGI